MTKKNTASIKVIMKCGMNNKQSKKAISVYQQGNPILLSKNALNFFVKQI